MSTVLAVDLVFRYSNKKISPQWRGAVRGKPASSAKPRSAAP
jgi:hypothetical protein